MRYLTRTLLLVVAVAFLLVTPFPAEGAAWIVPGLANADGVNGTHFSSDIVLLNRGPSPATVTILLVGSSDSPPVSRSVGPEGMLVLENVLKTLWGLSGRAGAVQIASDQPLLISARTYNDADPIGTYGLALEPVPTESLLGPGDVARALWVSHSADGSVGYRTNLAVVLTQDGSSADFILYDGTGKELGRTTFSGPAGQYQVSVGSLTDKDVPLGRADLRVNSGRATGYAAVVDNLTGDGIAAQALLSSGVSDAVINGVARASGREGTFYRTDLRLLNPGTAAVDVTVALLAISTGGSTSTTLHLAAGELREIQDILGSEPFRAPEGTSGALRLTSGAAFQALARTSNVKRDGSPGTFGALQPAVPLGAFTAAGGNAALTGLMQSGAKPGYRTNVGFLAGDAGATLTLSLRDAAGAVVSRRSGALSLGPFDWQQPSLADLFPGTTIPPRASLEVEPSAGSIDVYASVIDNGTGDPVISHSQRFESLPCAAPQVVSFAAVPEVLALAGPVTLFWSVAGADTVSLGADGRPFPSSSTLAIPLLSASKTFTLAATGPCGTTTTDLAVPVGSAPAPTLPITSGSPGQLMTIRPVGIAPSSVSGVYFVLPGGKQVLIRPGLPTDAGEIRILVPYLPTSVAPGHVTGTVGVVLSAGGAVRSAPVPFTFLPLSYAGDAPAALRTFVTALESAAKSTLAGERGLAVDGVTGIDAFVDSISTAVTPYADILRRAADSATAGSSFALPFDLPTAKTPSPQTTPLTPQDVVNLVAIIENLKVSLPAMQGPVSTGRVCILSDPMVAACKVKSLLQMPQVVEGLVNVVGFTGNTLELSQCVYALAQSGIGAAVGHLKKLSDTMDMICKVLPVALDHFSLSYQTRGGYPPAPPVPVDGRAYGRMQATLRSDSVPDALAKYLVNLATGKIEKELGRLATACAAQASATLSTLTDPLFDYFTSKISDAIAKLIGTPALTRTLTVGACDLPVVRVADGRILTKLADGDPDFYELQGIRDGVTDLEILPRELSFVFPSDRKDGPYLVSVQVGNGVRPVMKFTGKAYRTNTYPNPTDQWPNPPAASTTIVDKVTLQMPGPFQNARCGVQRQDDGRWYVFAYVNAPESDRKVGNVGNAGSQVNLTFTQDKSYRLLADIVVAYHAGKTPSLTPGIPGEVLTSVSLFANGSPGASQSLPSKRFTSDGKLIYAVDSQGATTLTFSASGDCREICDWSVDGYIESKPGSK